MGEILYNGIKLPDQWPPKNLDPKSHQPSAVPYLISPPEVIPIDVGRQLFVDDFLIEETTLNRRYYLTEKYEGNPILTPETGMERNGGYRPVAVPFSDGVFFDPRDRLFKMWYQAGWFDGTALATSRDGFHWDRLELDVVEGTNCVMPPRPDQIRDGVSIWLDQETENSDERFKMSLFARTEEILSGCDYRLFTSVDEYANNPVFSKGLKKGIRLFTSPDGIHWDEREHNENSGDNTTFFYNPFRKKWVFSIRHSRQGKRMRDYYESSDFLEGCKWPQGESDYWARADDLDLPDPKIGDETQLYKIDAVAYESVLLGLILIHRGPENRTCLSKGFPKLTDITVAYSRDGFHWHRPDRRSFIGATQRKGDWDRAYIHSAGGVCLIVEDQLFFYHGGWSGVSPVLRGDMYAGGSTGIAFLRRDGFASMDSGHAPGFLTTRKIVFSGKHLFVNADVPEGELRAEIQQDDGRVVAGYSLSDCTAVSEDGTKHLVRWSDSNDLSAFAGKPVRIRFSLVKGKLFSFWVSNDRTGASRGYVAAGGPTFDGPVDTTGG